jgi:hypothetical protein
MGNRKSDPAFARKGETSPLGKLDDRIDPFKIEGVVKAELNRQAAENDMTLAEYMREISRIVALGRDTVKSLYATRIERVGKKLDE